MPGSADGPGSIARFDSTNGGGIAADASGAIYIADSSNQTIRRMTPDAVVTTVLGSARQDAFGVPQATSLLLANPSSVAVDSAGNIYVAQHPGIFRFAPDKTFSVPFNTYGLIPQMVVDPHDNVLFVDEIQSQVWRLSSGGTPTKLAGSSNGLSGYADGSGDAALFNSPGGVTVTPDGSVYVADSINFVIRKIDSGGTVTTIAGSPGTSGLADGSGLSAQFEFPQAMGSDSNGNLYVADGQTIRRVTPAGDVTTLAGEAEERGSVDGTGSAARFYNISGLAVTGTNDIYAFDNSTIRKVTLDGAVTTVAGAASTGPVDGALAEARFVAPTGITGTAAGTLYIADIYGNAIRKITSDGVVSTVADYTAGLSGPAKVAVDGTGNLYVANFDDSTIRKISTAGDASLLAGGSYVTGSADGVGADARFNNPSGVAVDAEGNVYVADTGNYLIRKITPDGTVTTLAGMPGGSALVDGQGSNARFLEPMDLTVDGDGNLWVADYGAVRKVTPAGAVTTVAGSAASPQQDQDGIGAQASFDGATGIALAPGGVLFVADSSGATIRRVTTDGVVTTVAGRWIYGGGYGATDGQGADAQFHMPQGIYVNGAGVIYVADRGNAAIREIIAGTPPQIDTQPQSTTIAAGGNATLTTHASGAGTTYQWLRNGDAVSDATGVTLALNDVQPADAGLYAVVAMANSIGATSDVAIVGISTSSPVVGAGEVVGTDILHPNGNHFDQVLVTGAAETITTQGGRITRTSYTDLNDNIVQVEFAGAGTLTLVLDAASGPALPVNYNQNVDYMKGHAGIVIVGADETTNVSVFTVGRATAFDPTGHYDITKPISATNVPADNGSPLFQGHAGTHYDGVAQISFMAIASTDGKFGGVRTANARYLGWSGLTGVYAPNVQFVGPVYIGNLDAAGSSTPMIITGSVSDARITGGNLNQDNGKAIEVSGLTQLKFTAGVDSAGNGQPAQRNLGTLEQNGQDVTSQIVVNP